ncbi:DDE-type integrase/transposase/recombinase [Streptomyces sp. NRRL B-1347]|uniref:DDE-type integrase/transposase/recombinase n=1 Tax=Streptomyces sp. NRRL B-1347 TaxID=1476877 RepID=UPI00068D0648|nr:DDE-type integrase/transposase/recombinase [Streptomyces sp. NRRL B-1347]
MGEVADADPAVAVGVISSCKAEQRNPYRTACRALGVSESWFYKWRERPPTAREIRWQDLAEEIEEIFRSSGGTGHAMGTRHDAELVVASLHIAAATRGGGGRSVIMHTDRGSEYCSGKFRRACRKLGVIQSMGRVGSCFDNAVSEAFNSILKVEYVHRHTFATRTEARIRIATWITDFYNARRLHSVCGFKSPIDYERDYQATLTEGLAA